ncbi:MAG: hypothetical protein M3393_03750 [Actinomycetota bacterium]|nr:hypothetical protein [Actinomycetota bacterium]MDQ3615734.1 hypothetical protein [Actinomycetota bacterium]
MYALGYRSDAIVTLVVESWPLLAAFLLTAVIERFHGLAGRQVLWGAVAAVGFYFLIVSPGEILFHDLSVFALGAAIFSALTQAVAVSAHQRSLQDVSKDLHIEKNFLLQALRMFLAAHVSLGLALATGGASAPSTIGFGSAAGVAVAIMTSALLYGMSLQVAFSAVTTVMWFLTPVISIALLAVAGLAEVTTNIIVGATLVIGASIFLHNGGKRPPLLPR